MAQNSSIIIICFNLFIVLHPLMASISSGFRLKLTHRDSPDSPLYQPNLSDFQRFRKNVQISQSRASYFAQLTEIKIQNNASLRLPLMYHEPIYTVEIGIGTPGVKRTLVFDTGSHLTWTQCKPCIICFKQKQPLFDSKKSSTYRLMSRKNKLAKRFTCNALGCVYFVSYYSRQFSAGVVAEEDFTFLGTNARFPRRVHGLVFGCGTGNHGEFGPTRVISGILGLDKDPVSFARQLGSRIKSRFSYCLPVIDSKNTKGSSYLRFGEEASIRGKNAQSTPFVGTKQNALYVLSLSDISIGGKNLGLGQGTFPQGCCIDSGSSISLLNENAFFAVGNFLDSYFSKFKNVTRDEEEDKGWICYTHPAGFKTFPDMTFHFQGADFRVPWDNLFMLEKDGFCLAMMESKNVTILGAYQQRNVRIVYDLMYDTLSFAPEDCSRDTT